MKIKEYLTEEIASKISDSDYFFLTNYEGTTVLDVQDLRGRLSQHGARFHVIKNRLLKRVLDEKGVPMDRLRGPTALVSGGDNAPGVAKVLKTFAKEKSKNEKSRFGVKSGVLNEAVITSSEIDNLAELPSLEVLRAQFVGLLNTPATQLLRVCKAVPESMARVLQAQVDKKSA